MDIRNIDGLWCDDITFCPMRCGWKDCPRNKVNIRDRSIPHSFSVEIPQDCPKKQEMAVKTMPDRENVIAALHCRAYDDDFPCWKCAYYKQDEKPVARCDYRGLMDDAISLLKEQETMNVDTFMQWCIDSHIMGDATVRGIKYWVEKFKEGR